MITIGIIDDSEEQRDSFKKAIEIYLKKSKIDGVEIIDIEPLEHEQDYITWIAEHQISSLIVDERLAVEPLKATGKSCGYEGHDMAKEIRENSNMIPIHVVTSTTINANLRTYRHLFESITRRGEFENHRDQYVQIFIRSAQRFYELNQIRLERVAELSHKLVDRSASPKDVKELLGLQEYFQLPHFTEEIKSRGEMLDEFSKDLSELQKLNNEAKIFLNRKSS